MNYLIFILIVIGGVYLTLLAIELLTYGMAVIFRILVNPHPKHLCDGKRYAPNTQSYPQTIKSKQDIMQCFKLSHFRPPFSYNSKYSSNTRTNNNIPNMIFQERKCYSNSVLSFIANAHKCIIRRLKRVSQPKKNDTHKKRAENFISTLFYLVDH